MVSKQTVLAAKKKAQALWNNASSRLKRDAEKLDGVTGRQATDAVITEVDKLSKALEGSWLRFEGIHDEYFEIVHTEDTLVETLVEAFGEHEDIYEESLRKASELSSCEV